MIIKKLPIKEWRRRSGDYQDDIISSLDLRWTEEVAKAENAFLFEIINTINDNVIEIEESE